MLVSILVLKHETNCLRITREPEASFRSDLKIFFEKNVRSIPPIESRNFRLKQSQNWKANFGISHFEGLY
jgi:hypothetical protein